MDYYFCCAAFVQGAGIRREFFDQISAELLNQDYCLFTQSADGMCVAGRFMYVCVWFGGGGGGETLLPATRVSFCHIYLVPVSEIGRYVQ